MSREARPLLIPELPAGRGELAALMADLLDLLAPDSGAEVGVRLVDDPAMAELNREFLGLTGPTNVLSFPFEEEQAGYLGDIALNLDAVEREAFLYGQPPRAHMVRLLAHGVLHLMGLDHGPEMDSLTESAVSILS